jgi:DNA-binding NarL/FixJ family response regulator
MRRLRLVIADDHPLMLEAIELALSAGNDFEIVGTAASGTDVIALTYKVDPDVVLLDLRLPDGDGWEVLRSLRGSGAKLVVLSASDEPDVVERALRGGACAFITKRIDPHDLAAALRQALDQTLFQPFRPNPLVAAGAPVGPTLTDRELAILHGVTKGMSNRQIAERLSYAEQTVKLDLSRVYRKLGVSSRTEAMAVAYRTGLVTGSAADAAPT